MFLGVNKKPGTKSVPGDQLWSLIHAVRMDFANLSRRVGAGLGGKPAPLREASFLATLNFNSNPSNVNKQYIYYKYIKNHKY
jgi:hypothetical protein